MKRLTRITAVLIQLQSKRIVTAKEIAERFEISLRTVYRDIKTLQDSGVPIGSENGVGYFIVDGFRLPPISLTEEEANSLIISETFIKKQGDKSLAKNYDSLIIKIKATLKNFQKENLALLSTRTLNFTKDKINESNWLSDIQKSISNKIQLEINYRSLYKEELTLRKIEPQAIYYTNNTWIVIAFCHLRDELREFRLDRILKLNTTMISFEKMHSFNFQEYIENL
ncbi:helix-turn-helix transcriptional regulator [Maribacter litoralis]|uniref:helix-turn-helix transcriptional regulator n=1 Tax=Maribacter litoralis TaxID=2059726 RepID=UPI000E31B167|nr:YafY family protein [Maribacter litoralis]